MKAINEDKCDAIWSFLFLFFFVQYENEAVTSYIKCERQENITACIQRSVNEHNISIRISALNKDLDVSIIEKQCYGLKIKLYGPGNILKAAKLGRVRTVCCPLCSQMSVVSYEAENVLCASCLSVFPSSLQHSQPSK